MTYRKIGGLHFLRIGRFQISWCLRRKAKPSMVERKLTIYNKLQREVGQ